MPEASGHIANEGQWWAVCILPDYCKVGSSIVPFDSFAVIDCQARASPDVEILEAAVFRVGDLHSGVLADAGEGVPSGTSLGAGYVKFLTGQSDVLINGAPAVCHASLCLINCNASGFGGALGRLLTDLLFAAPPASTSPSPELQALLDEAADDRSFLQKAGDFAASAWKGTKRVVSAVVNDPGDAGIGLLKGVGNTPTDLWNLGVLVTKHGSGQALQADLLNRAAVEAYRAGDIARANELAAQGHEIATSAYADDLFKLENDAQKGGSFISMFIPFGAIAKSASTASKLARGVKVADATADAAKTARALDGATDVTHALDDAHDALKAADAAGNAPKPKPGLHIGPGSNHVKAAFGEKTAHDLMKSKGMEPLGKTDGIYKPGSQGIDGVYKNPKPPPEYIITEVKYGTSKLKKGLADGTNQMDDEWVQRRLIQHVGPSEARNIMKAMREGRVDKLLINVAEDGATKLGKIDSAGTPIRGKAGKPAY